MRKRLHGSEFVGSTPVAIHTGDGVALGATEFRGADPPRATLLIHGATAVPQTYYARFATYLAEQGVRVITYDYRGVGASRGTSLRHSTATMSDWAFRDAPAAMTYARISSSGRPLVTLGHSFGGQLLALHDSSHRVAGSVLVGVQFGYLGHWAWPRRAQLAWWMRGVVPAASKLAGYVPGWAGLGEDLPAGVASEWAKWCRHPEYLAAYVPGALERLGRFDKPTLSFSFTDDEFAPKRAVDHFHALLARAPLHHVTLHPRELGVPSVGHFGFFRRAVGEPLWNSVLAFVARVTTDTTPRLDQPGAFHTLGAA
jgi:predicted alpha/beta hydrolase